MELSALLTRENNSVYNTRSLYLSLSLGQAPWVFWVGGMGGKEPGTLQLNIEDNSKVNLIYHPPLPPETHTQTVWGYLSLSIATGTTKRRMGGSKISNKKTIIKILMR